MLGGKESGEEEGVWGLWGLQAVEQTLAAAQPLLDQAVLLQAPVGTARGCARRHLGKRCIGVGACKGRPSTHSARVAACRTSWPGDAPLRHRWNPTTHDGTCEARRRTRVVARRTKRRGMMPRCCNQASRCRSAAISTTWPAAMHVAEGRPGMLIEGGVWFDASRRERGVRCGPQDRCSGRPWHNAMGGWGQALGSRKAKCSCPAAASTSPKQNRVHNQVDGQRNTCTAGT